MHMPKPRTIKLSNHRQIVAYGIVDGQGRYLPNSIRNETWIYSLEITNFEHRPPRSIMEELTEKLGMPDGNSSSSLWTSFFSTQDNRPVLKLWFRDPALHAEYSLRFG